MTGPTHRQYGICFAYILCIIIYIYGITEVNYYLAMIILLMTAKVGSVFPDLDHDWHNIGDKTVMNKIINTLIHTTGGRHRSWQTHSWDICAYFIIATCILPNYLYNLGIITNVNKEVLLLLMAGFASGWASHLFADMLTSAGVRLTCFSKYKLKLVPKKLGPLVFKTGDIWEDFNYKTIKILNILLFIICVGYPVVY